MTKKYYRVSTNDKVFLYDKDNGTKPIAGFNQMPFTIKQHAAAKREHIIIEEGLEWDKNYLEDCRTGLLKLRDQVDCLFTSPPYSCSKDYGDSQSEEYNYNDSQPYDEYLLFMKEFMCSAYVALKEGGVFGLNISNIMSEGQKRPTGIDLLNIAIDVGFTFQEHIMWVKPLGSGKQRTGSYILSYQKYQDRLKALQTFRQTVPGAHLKHLKARKKEILAKLNTLKKAGKNDTDEYQKLDKDRYDTNNAIRVLALINEGKGDDEIKQILKQEAAQVYRPNPITEYIWILTKGEDITNKTVIDLKRVKDQMYNIWYNKTRLQLKESLTKDLIGSDIDKILIKDSIPDVAIKLMNKALSKYGETIEKMTLDALERVRPKLKKETDMTPTKITRAFKAIYEEKVQEVKKKLQSRIVNKLSKSIEHNKDDVCDVLAESFAMFYRQFSDNWDMAPTNTKVRHHPAPFPVDLPCRFIELYLPEGGLIVDPFVGAGSSAQAVVRLNKKYNRNYHYIGFDISKEYIDLANKFIKRESIK